MKRPLNHLVRYAEQIARTAHARQFRRDGVTPYITHPQSVARWLEHEDAAVQATAWLHDVLEDGDPFYSKETLRNCGLPENVIEAVVILTKKPDQSYESYLAAVRANEIALKVKVQDMLHNLSDQPTQDQMLKYARGLRILLK